MRCSWLVVSFVVVISAGQSRAGTEVLALASQIQYSKVISGAVDPITTFIYNKAPPGSDAGNFTVAAAYAPPNASGYTNFNYYYSGTKLADGGSGYLTASFPLNTSGFEGGNVAVTTTLTDTATGGSITQGGQFTVLDHASPGIYLQGQVIPLSSKTVVKFQTPDTNVDTSALELGGVSTASAMGMQGRSPTAELDLDSITESGSPDIASTLAPFDDLPSDSDPSEGTPFNLDFDADPGDYNATFYLFYSDEQDLPGADTPGSQLAMFNVDVNVEPGVADWTVTTDVPEPGSIAIMLAFCGICMRRRAIAFPRRQSAI